MILLRSQNLQQPLFSPKSPSDYHTTICKQQPQQVSIYPCCYQIYTHHHSQSTQKLSQKHTCILGESTLSQNMPKPIRLDLNSSQTKTSNNFNLEKPIVSCSVCQKSSISETSLTFYNCLHCKKQFCSKCNSQVHSKGKFLSHQIFKLKQKQQISLNQSNFSICQTHSKLRKYLLKNKVACELCVKEQSGKLPPQDMEVIDPSFMEENIKFSLQYFNEIYHNQANKMTQLKQNLNKFYKDCLERLQHKYKSSLGQIQKIQNNIKTNFSQTITELTLMNTQVQNISANTQSFLNFISKQVLNTRINLIQQKMFEIQSQSEQFINQISYDYKIGDKDKNQQLIEQFLKCINLIKIKRHQDEVMDTNRSSFRHNIKTSRTTSRLSSHRLTNSKDNRCQSSFNKQQNMSSSKHNNSSFKEKQRNSLVKSYINNQDMNRKNTDLTKSIIAQNRNSMGKSISKTSSLQPSAVNSRNNSALFNEKERNFDVKELQKAEYQDLNLNLKKIMGCKKTNESQTLTLQSQNGSKVQSQSTSLEKNNKENDPKGNKLMRENEKSTVNSGSFLKVFDQKNKSGGRKNYLVSSGEELPDSQQKPNIIQVQSTIKASPQNEPQIKKKKIKDEIFGSNRGSSSNKFSQVDTYDKYKNSSPSVVNSIQSKKDFNSKNSQKSGQTSKQTIQNRSSIFDNLVALSEERKDQKTISDFNFKSGEDKVINDMTKSLVSQFSCIITGQGSQCYSYENLKDIQVTESINLQEQLRKPNRSPAKTNKSIAKPEVSKSIFKDSTNTLKGAQKMPNEKANTMLIDKQQLKKKPDFMDMRQKMRKPNYLSSRLNSNLNGPVEASKKMQHGKK